jgi:hypothetical protein
MSEAVPPNIDPTALPSAEALFEQLADAVYLIDPTPRTLSGATAKPGKVSD